MTEKKFHEMSPKERAAARFHHSVSDEFAPSESQGAELRIAHALEFIAFRIGKIDDKLGELIDLLKASREERHGKSGI